jgi:hypothetical protein
LQHHYACYEDIKALGDRYTRQPADRLWTRLRDALHRVDILPANAGDDPENLLTLLRRQFSKAQGRGQDLRVLVLLDEVDCLLDADSESGFSIVTYLRQMMNETDRRFKVVLAGLHNVQRFQAISNQPLAHFGPALQVGPLEPRDAWALVERPLMALGYRFDGREPIMRILSYTNYHPGLLQLFCDALLRRLLHPHRPLRGGPPHLIRDKDVEETYLDRGVRNQIRDRFELTLALDARYKLIALVMAQRQLENAQGDLSAKEAQKTGCYWRMPVPWRTGWMPPCDSHGESLPVTPGCGSSSRSRRMPLWAGSRCRRFDATSWRQQPRR